MGRALSPESMAIAIDLKAHGTSSLEVLLTRLQAVEILRQPLRAENGRSWLVKRLANMADNGWLDYGWNSSGTKQWWVRPAARSLVPNAEAATLSALVAATVAPVLAAASAIAAAGGLLGDGSASGTASAGFLKELMGASQFGLGLGLGARLVVSDQVEPAEPPAAASLTWRQESRPDASPTGRGQFVPLSMVDREPPRRPGAEDFRSLKSHGVKC